MLQLSSVKEKITWKVMLVLGLYLVALALFVLVYVPTKNRIEFLETQLEQVTQREAALARVVEQRSGLQAQLQKSETNLELYSRQIPSQYDLPKVLEALEAIGSGYDVRVEILDHTPVRTIPGKQAGTISLIIGLDGSNRLFSYISHVQEVLPSLDITHLALGYLGDERFTVELRANLQVFVLKGAPNAPLTLPEVAEVGARDLRAEVFARSFEIIGQFLGNKVRVLGIVQTDNEASALLVKDGVRSWIRVGDRLGEALVTDISASSVSLDVDGVDLKLAIGG